MIASITTIRTISYHEHFSYYYCYVYQLLSKKTEIIFDMIYASVFVCHMRIKRLTTGELNFRTSFACSKSTNIKLIYSLPCTRHYYYALCSTQNAFCSTNFKLYPSSDIFYRLRDHNFSFSRSGCTANGNQTM